MSKGRNTAKAFSRISTRRTVADAVYEQLHKALMWGHFNAGDRITINALAQEFETSHMPVREALRRLVAENGLEIAQDGTAYVPLTTRARLDDICMCRQALEGMATELATERAATKDLMAIELAATEHRAMAAADEVYQMLESNYSFHFTIYELAGSAVLLNFINVLWLQLGPYMRLLTNHIADSIDEGHYHPLRDSHLDITAAMRQGHANQACALIQKDISTTQFLLQDLCSQ